MNPAVTPEIPGRNSHGAAEVTHGAHRFERRLLTGDLDGRERETKLLKHEVAALVAERGGDAAVGVGERTLIERAAFKSVMLQIVEAHVLSQPTPLKDGALLPVLGKQYLSWANSLRRDLEALGLRPPKPDPENLADYLAAHDATEDDPTPGSEAADTAAADSGSEEAP